MTKTILLTTSIRETNFTVTLYTERKDPDYGPVYLGWEIHDDVNDKLYGDKLLIPDEKEGDELAFKLILTQLLESFVALTKK